MNHHAQFRGIEQNAPGLYLVKPTKLGPRYTCDIFFVHGLGGGPASTWMHSESGKIWFKDFLPDYIPDERDATNARIWTFGYNANFAFGAAEGGVPDFAKQLLSRVQIARRGCEHHKIIWICHSLGGIVVKQVIKALVQAALSGHADHQSIKRSTVGVIFLGTPHQGSVSAGKAAMVASIAEALFNPNTKLLRSLKRNSDTLFERDGQFANISAGIKIVSFYEMRPVTRHVIVEKSSAVMNVPGETSTGLDADHRGVCKFADTDDQNFALVLFSIRDLMRLTKRPPPPPPAASTRRMPDNFQTNSAQPPNRRDMGARHYNANNLSREMENMNMGDGIPARRPAPSQPNYQAYKETFKAPYPTERNGGTPDYGDGSSSAQVNRGPSVYGNQSPPAPPAGQPFRWQPPEQTSQTSDLPPRPSKPVPPQTNPSWTSGTRERATSNVSTASGHSASTATAEPANRSTSNLSPASGYSTSTSAAATNPPSRISTPYSNVGLGREEFSRPSTTSHLHPDPQTGPSSRSQSRSPTRASSTTPVQDPTPDGPAYICDVCIKEFSWATPRTRCTECDDYDICPRCFQSGKVSDKHKSTHKVRQILKSHRLLASSSDLTPASIAVNPEFTPPRTLPDWTVLEGSEQRWLHLRNAPSHARFMNTSIDETGWYIMRFVLRFVLSEHVTTDIFTQLKKLGLGKLRISAGAPVSNRVFFREKKTESLDTLASELFTGGGYEDFELKIPDHVTGPKTDWVEDYEVPIPIEIKVNTDTQGVVGILLQWKEVQEFQNRDDVILMMSLAEVQMDELLEHDEPSPPKPTPALPVKTSDTSNEVSLMEFLEAIGRVQRQQEQEQEQEQSAEAIFGALLAQNIVNQYNENLARLRIQQYLQEQKEKKEQEERLRMQAILRQLQMQKEREEQEAREQLARQIFLRSLFQS